MDEVWWAEWRKELAQTAPSHLLCWSSLLVTATGHERRCLCSPWLPNIPLTPKQPWHSALTAALLCPQSPQLLSPTPTEVTTTYACALCAHGAAVCRVIEMTSMAPWGPQGPSHFTGGLFLLAVFVIISHCMFPHVCADKSSLTLGMWYCPADPGLGHGILG